MNIHWKNILATIKSDGAGIHLLYHGEQWARLTDRRGNRHHITPSLSLEEVRNIINRIKKANA